MVTRAESTMMNGPIAVIDLETTGLFPRRHDRVVEVAAVVINPDGTIEREFTSLVNPLRDIGPTSIHGLTSEDILGAPRFDEVAPMFIDALSGAVTVAGHNVRFDREFLEHEFRLMGLQLPEFRAICTMRLAGGGTLASCCKQFGVAAGCDRHNALSDARATAELLIAIWRDDPGAANAVADHQAICWPALPPSTRQPLTRDASRAVVSQPPAFLQRLLASTGGTPLADVDDGSTIAYGALIDRVLEDRLVDDVEAEELIAMATKWGLSGDQIERVHLEYLNQLTIAAVGDGHVTDVERRDLKHIARLLGQSHRNLDDLLDDAMRHFAEVGSGATDVPSTTSDLAGLSVCFTGELQCRLHGMPIERELAQELAETAGLFVQGNVTKKLDLLVIADPYSQSGKAKKARQYGVRIMHEPVFWRSIGIPVD